MQQKVYQEQKSNLRVAAKRPRSKIRRPYQGKVADLIHDCYRVNDLEKSDFEKRAIRECLRAFRQVLRELGLSVIFRPDLKYFHVLTRQEYVEKIKLRRAPGLYSQGNVYLQRSRSRHNFVYYLCHETAHLLSFLKLSVVVEKGELGGADSVINTECVGLGKDLKFSGFDEGVTEMLAVKVREILAKTSRVLSPWARKRLLAFDSYQKAIDFIEELLKQCAVREKRRERLRNEIFRSYILGGQKCFTEMRLNKMAMTAIKKMAASEADIVRTAKKLGLPLD